MKPAPGHHAALRREPHHEAHEAHEPRRIGIDPGWEEISWDEAYDLILEKLDEQKQNKPVIVFALITSIISWIDSMNWLGNSSNIPIPFKADICGAPTHPISALLTGCGGFPTTRTASTSCSSARKRAWPRVMAASRRRCFADARANGCKLVNFDPHMSRARPKADEWVPIRPEPMPPRWRSPWRTCW